MFTPKEDLHQLKKLDLLHYFTSLFNGMTLRHTYYNVFDHFLDCSINGFCVNYDNEIMEHIRKKYTQDERYTFGEMLRTWIAYMNKEITNDNMFYDFLGNFYEQQAISKQKGFAQYFTPEPICKFMVSVLAVKEDAGYVAEPACGSGRLNLAMHAQNHELFHVANDVDYTCAKMAALNFMVHGIKGIVTCDDALIPRRSFKGAFVVNYRTAPYLEFIDDVDTAYAFINYNVPSAEQEQQPERSTEQVPVKPVQDTTVPTSNTGTQLKLF